MKRWWPILVPVTRGGYENGISTGPPPPWGNPSSSHRTSSRHLFDSNLFCEPLATRFAPWHFAVLPRSELTRCICVAPNRNSDLSAFQNTQVVSAAHLEGNSSTMSCSDCISGNLLPGSPKGTEENGVYLASGSNQEDTKDKAVVVLTDIFGLVPNPKIIADTIAERTGFDVWVPDLFNGVSSARI